jgi:hypothetical protein
MSSSAGEPGIAKKENSSDDQRHLRASRISYLPIAFGCFGRKPVIGAWTINSPLGGCRS